MKELNSPPKRAIRKKDRDIVDLMMIINHFFAALSSWLNEMDDPRDQSYILYTQSDLVWMGLLKNMCAVRTMRSMEDNFNKETCIETLRLLSGDKSLNEMPHADTLNYYLEKLSPQCLADIRKRMIQSLIRGKSFYKAKLLGKHWRVILDGTGLFYFKEKHCDNCLVTTIKDVEGKEEKRYYHKVLEAKIVLGEHLILSLDTEFIENEDENVSKQDCEINAAKRILSRLKEDYPRLPACIQGDALYAAQTVMGICRENGWEYILTQKDTRQKLLSESYEWIASGGGKTEIENEGFNNQKNGIYDIEHLNSHNGRAMKNHYLLTQIADIIMQLYLLWNPAVRKTGQSKRNTSSRLLESFRSKQ